MSRQSRKLPIGQGHYGIPEPPIRRAVHSVLGPTSRGCHLSPGMRLVATMMILWEEDWHRLSNGRYGMSAAEIADRTSLTEAQVQAIMAKLVDVNLAMEMADGWKLTLEAWIESHLRPWVARANQRPVR